MEFGFIFDYDQFESVEDLTVQRQRRRSSLPPRIQAPFDGSPRATKDHTVYTTHVTHEDKASFSLTGITLDYLKSKSTLVAVLSSLVASEENQSATSFHDLPEDQKLIRKFRLENLRTTFPKLYQHLMLQVVPVERGRNPETSESFQALMTSNLSEIFRICLLCSPDQKQYHLMVHRIIRHLLEQGKWDELLRMLDEIPESAVQSHEELISLRNFLLCCVAQSQGASVHTGVSEAWRYLLQITDPLMKSRAVSELDCLSVFLKLTMNWAEEILTFIQIVTHRDRCSDHFASGQQIRAFVRSKIVFATVQQPLI